MPYSPAFPDYVVPFCGENCPCRLEESRCVIRCACGISEIGEPCAYCESVVSLKPATREADTRQEQREADAAKLAEVAAEARRETSDAIDVYLAGAKDRLAAPPSKPSKKRGTGVKRGPNRITKARWAAEDAARGTSLEEFPTVLLDENDPLPLLPYEIEDVALAIRDSLEGEK